MIFCPILLYDSDIILNTKKIIAGSVLFVLPGARQLKERNEYKQRISRYINNETRHAHKKTIADKKEKPEVLCEEP